MSACGCLTESPHTRSYIGRAGKTQHTVYLLPSMKSVVIVTQKLSVIIIEDIALCGVGSAGTVELLPSFTHFLSH